MLSTSTSALITLYPVEHFLRVVYRLVIWILFTYICFVLLLPIRKLNCLQIIQNTLNPSNTSLYKNVCACQLNKAFYRCELKIACSQCLQLCKYMEKIVRWSIFCQGLYACLKYIQLVQFAYQLVKAQSVTTKQGKWHGPLLGFRCYAIRVKKPRVTSFFQSNYFYADTLSFARAACYGKYVPLGVCEYHFYVSAKHWI